MIYVIDSFSEMFDIPRYDMVSLYPSYRMMDKSYKSNKHTKLVERKNVRKTYRQSYR